MKKILLLALLISPYLAAEEYQSFIELNHTKTDFESELYEFESSTLGFQHYFEPRISIGPLNEFGFINTNSNVGGSYTKSDQGVGYSSKSWQVDGELFVGDFLIGVDHYDFTSEIKVLNYNSSFNRKNYTLGYLANKDLLFKVSFDDDHQARYSAQYNHQINEKDYLGFSLSVDEDLDSRSFASTYFKVLSNGSYIKASMGLSQNESSSHWGGGASYYFNPMTSIFISTDKKESYTFGARHFFTTHFSTLLTYVKPEKDSMATDVFRLSLMAQF